jgi:hypothetical protein
LSLFIVLNFLFIEYSLNSQLYMIIRGQADPGSRKTFAKFCLRSSRLNQTYGIAASIKFQLLRGCGDLAPED